jgi:hypothetical protein
MTKSITSWHVGVAAEAIAAAQFARCGFDVSVQYGADQPEYDLIVVKGEHAAKISVKGSQDGEWGLTQSFLEKADYHKAIERWASKFGRTTIMCFVQFKGVAIDQMPRVYLATPAEVAKRLKATARGRGDTILYEHHEWGARAIGAGTTEAIPTNWGFSCERMEHLLLGIAQR